jgi:hypothetical protein
MTDLWTFARLLSDVAPPIELVDGCLFLDRFGGGRDALLLEIAKHSDAQTAQQWINLVPIDDFLDCAVSDWSIDDPLIQDIADVYARSWMSIIKSQYGIRDGLSVEVLKDKESGDVVLRLNQS